MVPMVRSFGVRVSDRAQQELIRKSQHDAIDETKTLLPMVISHLPLV